jgi:predicted amidophosphoribosyltransferase
MANMGGMAYFCQRHSFNQDGICVECGKKKLKKNNTKSHKHVYDEYGLCFECDKQKPASQAYSPVLDAIK